MDLLGEEPEPDTGLPWGLDTEEAPPPVGTRRAEDADGSFYPDPPPDLRWVLAVDTELMPSRAATMGGWTPIEAIGWLCDEYGVTGSRDRWYLRRLLRHLDTGRAVGRDWTDDDEDSDG